MKCDNRVGMINILEYQYGDTKGAAKRGQVFSSPLGYQGTDSEYTSAQTTEKIDSTIQTALTGEGYTPAWGPVTKAYVITSEGVKDVEITTEEDGGLQSKTYKSVLKNSDAKEGDTLVYLYDNETVPVDAPEIKLDIRSLPIETRSRKLKAVWSFDAEYELNKEYGVEMSASLASQATAEIGQEIDTEIMNDLYRAANSGPEIVWSRTQPAGVSQIDHYDSFYTELVRGSNQIFGATRRSRANWMVCGLGVLAVLKVMRNFDDAEDLTAIGPHFVGTIGGIRVFVNPWFDENVFVLGYKGPNMIDAGYVYAPLTSAA